MSEPTREEHAAALEHDPKTCHICCSPHHGDQAPDPLELENDRLREQVATLTARVENAEAGSVVAKEYIARLVAERDAAREELGRMNDGWGKHAGRAMDAAVAEEREACAHLADLAANNGDEKWAEACACIGAIIRARGVKP